MKHTFFSMTVSDKKSFGLGSKITILVHTFKQLWVKLVCSFYNNWSFKKIYECRQTTNVCPRSVVHFYAASRLTKMKKTSRTKITINEIPE